MGAIWRKLVHIICNILRWKSPNQLKGPFSLDEYQKAERMIFKLVEKKTERKELSSKPSIAQLCPIIDDNGLMGARGRWAIIQSGF